MNTNKIGRYSVIFSIVVVLNLFFNYTLSLIYKAPEYNDFCKVEQVVPTISTESQCVSLGGQWNPALEQSSVRGESTTKYSGYCDRDFTCRQNYDDARKDYERNVFVVLVILGALSVALGNFLVANGVIANGLSLAGVLSFIIASMRYWSNANDWMRVIILAIALGILFWVAVKRFGSKQ